MHNDDEILENTPEFPAWKRWLQAVSSHYAFHVCLSLITCFSFLPMGICIYLLVQTKAVVFWLLAIPLAGLTGPVWAAVNQCTREEQFGLPSCQFRRFFRRVLENFRKGYCLAVIFASCATMLLLPVVYAQYIRAELPLGILCILIVGAIVLCVISSYSFYQIIRWELPLRAVLKNSLILVFSVGPASLGVAALWLVFWTGLLLFPDIVVSLCLFLGLPVALCMTEQAFYVGRVEALMGDKTE